jgi:hypothetical protein
LIWLNRLKVDLLVQKEGQAKLPARMGLTTTPQSMPHGCKEQEDSKINIWLF